MVTRRVVLVCGPPGSGKTTYAHSLGLEVYDADDPQWTQRSFGQAITVLGRRRDAQAAVIRSGATRSARGKAAAQCGATETVVLEVAEDECIARVQQRAGAQQLVHREVAAIRGWWSKYEPDEATDLGATSERW